MDDIIKNLRELGSKHETHLSEIREKIRILDSIPKAKALQGKCFKHKNGFSFGHNRGGWTYKHVVGIAGENLIVDSFQISGPFKFEFTFNDLNYVSQFSNSAYIKISKKEYMKVYTQLLKQLAVLGKKRIKDL